MKDEPKQVPRMKTIDEIAALTGVPKHFIRQLAIQNKIVRVMAGRKYLINLDRFIDYLNTGEEQTEDEPETISKGRIRRLN